MAAEEEPTTAEVHPWARTEAGPWIDIERLPEAQEETVRQIAEEWGFKDLAGLAGFLTSYGLNYYDVIRAEYPEE